MRPKRQPLSAMRVSDWKEETSDQLEDARVRIESAIRSISGDPTKAQLHSIWNAYVSLELSIVYIKVEIDEENPGRFIRAREYRVPDERQALRFALNNLVKGKESFRVGAYAQAVKELREARNYLRVLLKGSYAKERKAARRAR